MDTLDFEPITTEEVMSRYGIKSRTTLNKFLNDAGVPSFKEGRETFIKAFQLQSLDEHARKRNYPIVVDGVEIQSIQPGGCIQPSECIQSGESIQPSESIQSIVGGVNLAECLPISTMDLLYVASEFEKLPRLAKWLAAYAFLEKMASGKVIMPRDVLLSVLDYKRLPPCRQGYFRWGGFVFFMIEENRREWLVSKNVLQSLQKK